MPRKPLGERPMTGAERQACQRDRKAAQVEAMRQALVRIQTIRTAHEAREVAASALHQLPAEASA